jgi:hypothetical protein
MVLVLIKKAMAEGRGCLFGVPGHAMVLIHYDEEKNIVKWVDNSDRSLRVQTMSIEKFNGRWQGWILVLYAEPDVIPYKILKLANQIPIVDHNNPQGQYPKDYVPRPRNKRGRLLPRPPCKSPIGRSNLRWLMMARRAAFAAPPLSFLPFLDPHSFNPRHEANPGAEASLSGCLR